MRLRRGLRRRDPNPELLAYRNGSGRRDARGGHVNVDLERAECAVLKLLGGEANGTP